MTENIDNPFNSFWMGGYECSDQLNNTGQRVDLMGATHHIENLDGDYRALLDFGIRTVREGIRWSRVERQPYEYDFSVVGHMLEVGKAHGIQQVWDICHFGFPDDLTPLHPQFTPRFTAICSAFAAFHRRECPDLPLIVTPINEVSFLSWLGGEVGGTSPFAVGIGWHVKYALMRAYVAGVRAIRDIDPSARILTTEPLVNVVPSLTTGNAATEEARLKHLEQFQCLDMLTGNICPELGGRPEYLDLLGFNFYHNNQWVLGLGEILHWANPHSDPRWLPLSQLLLEAYQRYHRPILLSETSHPGDHRPLWIRFIAEQCKEVLRQQIPLLGICIYPLIDRPDWDNLDHWHHSGLWDHEVVDGQHIRILNEEYAAELLKVQQGLPEDNIVKNERVIPVIDHSQ